MVGLIDRGIHERKRGTIMVIPLALIKSNSSVDESLFALN
jgi:hypothetical protein